MDGVPKRDPDEDVEFERNLGIYERSDEEMRALEAMPLTEWQRQEAERRLKEYERNPVKGRSWEEVRRQLESKR